MSRRVAAIGLFLLIVVLIASPIAALGVNQPAEQSNDRAHSLDAAPATNDVIERPNPTASGSIFAVGAGEFDRTVFSIEVYGNTTGRWTFRYSKILGDNETERENFRSFASDFRENETALYRDFVEKATGLATTGADVTGRSMNATAFSRDAWITPLGNRGIVEMSFTWTQLGQRSGDGVLVSDVFEGGIYIRSDQRMQFVAGPGLAFDTVEPLPSNTSGRTVAESDSITFVGERSFTDRHPYVFLQAVSTTTTAAPTETTTATTVRTNEATTTATERETTAEPTTAGGGPIGTGDGTTATTDDGSSPDGPVLGEDSFLLVVVASLLIAIGIGVAAWLNGYFEPGDGEGVEDRAGGDGAATESDRRVPDSEGSVTSGPAVENVELLSDRDRVEQLLGERGGRMKQTEIVDATDWSKSKVSMLLSEMEEDGEITKLRVGRENIITLPGSEPDAAGSPFEEREDGE